LRHIVVNIILHRKHLHVTQILFQSKAQIRISPDAKRNGNSIILIKFSDLDVSGNIFVVIETINHVSGT
jgi:hypothetical protein